MWKDLNKEELREIISQLCSKEGRSYRLKLFTDDKDNWKGTINLEIIEEAEQDMETKGDTFEMPPKGSGSCVELLVKSVGPNYGEGVFVKSLTFVMKIHGGRVLVSFEEREAYDIGEEVISTI